jgi:hypothetical protein
MCCCDVDFCCCGCTSLKTGVIIWACIDATIVVSVSIAAAMNLHEDFLFAILGAIVFDSLLIAGASTSNVVVLIIWQVFAMIGIVGWFVTWALSVLVVCYHFLVINDIAIIHNCNICV